MGGWWLRPEVTVFYPSDERSFQHDIVGWRRDRVPTSPKGFPVRERPDWVYEIAHFTMRKDAKLLPQTLSAAGVPWYWLVDVVNEYLRVFRWTDGALVEVQQVFREEGKVRIPPFEALEFKAGLIFGDEEEEEK